MVTWPGGAAVLVELRGAHLAAAASIHQRADTGGAERRLVGAVAHCRAASGHLENTNSIHCCHGNAACFSDVSS